MSNILPIALISVCKIVSLNVVIRLIFIRLQKGPLMGGPLCRLAILRNGNVPCPYF